MSKFGQTINTAPQPQRPLPDKEILWGSQDGGCIRFPAGKEAITERKFSDNPAPFLAFGRAVSEALDRVWIVDEYLLMPDRKKGDSDKLFGQKIQIRADKILEWLHVRLIANDIKFLTKQHGEIGEDVLAKLQMRAQEINNYSSRRPVKCSIEVRTHLTQKSCNYIHDRFAIIDDELWHFGGTVGGFHAAVSAASRGWRASDHGAIEFFEMAWKEGEQK